MKYLIIALVCFSTSVNSFSQSFSSLVAFVTDKDSGLPISNASIVVKEAGWSSKTTGSDGKAFFDKSMPIGEIRYIVSKDGYQGIEGTFNITTEVKSNTLNIKLSKFRDDRLLITGEVVDEDERDLQGAIVEVKVANIVRTATTDASGNYNIELTLNKSEYDVSTLKLEAKCKNGSGKKVETIDLTRRNVIYKDFKLSCTSNSVEAPILKKFEKGPWVISLSECKQSGSNINCTLSIVNNAKDAEFSIFPKGTSRIFTNNGYEYSLGEVRLADKFISDDNYEIFKSVVKGVPIKATLTFVDVPEDVDLIKKMEVSCRDLHDLNYFPFTFNDVKIKR